MDGTLTIAAHDFDDIRDQLELPQGVPILESIATLPDNEAREKHRVLHALEMEIAADTRPQPNAAQILATLQDKGYRLGILTRNAEDIAQATLAAAKLDQFFSTDDIIGRNRCAPKPDPAGIHLHMARWGGTENQTVMVGDFLYDLQTGRNAAVTTVHLDVSGNFSWPELTDIRIQTLEELTDYL